MAPTLQLVYPVTLPRIYGSEIKYEDLIEVEPLMQDLRVMSVRRVEFIAQLNTSEISAPNVHNIYQSGLEYLAYLHTLNESCSTMQAGIPQFGWRSGINGAAQASHPSCDSLKVAVNYEMNMVLAAVAGALTAYASFLIEFDDDANTVEASSLANVSKALGQAAGIYSYVNEHISARVCDILGRDRNDMPELQPKVMKGLSVYCCLCLQQVAYESARTTASNSLLAKISQQIVEYASQVPAHIPREYGFSGVMSHLTPVSYLYSIMANMHMARDEWAKDNWGIACAYGRVAKEFFAKLRDSELQLSSPILRNIIERESALVEKETAEFENDNNQVYFQRVPTSRDLPLIRGVTVKGPTKYEPGCQPEMVALLAQLNYTM